MMYFETHIRIQFNTFKIKYQIMGLKTTCVPWGTPVSHVSRDFIPDCCIVVIGKYQLPVLITLMGN